YNPDAAVPIADDNLRQRFERKRDADLEEIHNRMHEVEIERAYRIVGVLERTARDIEERAIPAISEAVSRWKKRVLWGDAIAYSLLLIGMFGISIKQGYWEGLHFSPPWLESLLNSPTAQISTGIGIVLVIVGIHFFIRSLSARSLLRKLRKQSDKLAIRGSLANAFLRNTKPWRSVFSKSPAGWGRGAKKRLAQVKEDADNYVQSLNDRFTNPSGEETFSLSEMSHHAPNAPTSVADADKELDSASTSQA
ncbi:MAG: alkaline shock response membrane anchor protein AmaP, partial [Sedimenticola sp.]|nr:alkaline shock response membrane anchor protein AmaP [Sedimenticola sp.]